MEITYPPDRQSARLLGSVKYFTGRPCPQQHIAPRFTSNGACTGCLGLREEEARRGQRVRVCARHDVRYSGRQCPGCRTEWRRANPPTAARRLELAEAQRVRAAACRSYVRQVKSEPCVDCRQAFPWYVMQFDHRKGHRGQGDSTVAALVSQGSLERLKAEIAKCDLVCANCHCIRTHLRAVEQGKRIA